MSLSVFVQYRWLLYALVIRDLNIRYKGSALGFLWTFLNPLLMMCVYTLVFSHFLRVETKAYPVFILCGILPWSWFSNALLQATISISDGGSYIGRTIFPTPVLPLVSVFSGLANFVFSLPLLFIFIFIYEIPVGPQLLLLPVLLIIQTLLLTGITMILSSLNVMYRDLQHILGHILSLIFFTQPIMYPVTAIPEKFQNIILHNPLTLLFRAYQQIFFYHASPKWHELLTIGVLSVVMYLIGRSVFNRYQESFPELI